MFLQQTVIEFRQLHQLWVFDLPEQPPAFKFLIMPQIVMNPTPFFFYPKKISAFYCSLTLYR